jgi:hypothetical protein
MVEIVEAGGGGKPFLTQPFGEKNEAIAAARRMLDRGVRG